MHAQHIHTAHYTSTYTYMLHMHIAYLKQFNCVRQTSINELGCKISKSLLYQTQTSSVSKEIAGCLFDFAISAKLLVYGHFVFCSHTNSFFWLGFHSKHDITLSKMSTPPIDILDSLHCCLKFSYILICLLRKSRIYVKKTTGVSLLCAMGWQFRYAKAF